MFDYVVDVIFTDRTRLPDGRYRTFKATVAVLAVDDVDASQAAIQMATAIRCDLDVMPLGCDIVSVVL